jgi:hypothetical protein
MKPEPGQMQMSLMSPVAGSSVVYVLPEFWCHTLQERVSVEMMSGSPPIADA